MVEEQLNAVMHEIRQPLSVVLALAEAARSLPDVPAGVRGYLDGIIEQGREVSWAAESVLAHCTGRQVTPDSPIDLDEVIDSVLTAIRLTWTGSLVREGDRGVLVASQGCRADLRRCLIDVVDNAVRAAGPRGQVTVSVERSEAGVRIVVDDDGPGFGRMPTGLGLGLEITQRTLAVMGGELAVGLRSGCGGARVVLSLPALEMPGVCDVARVG